MAPVALVGLMVMGWGEGMRGYMIDPDLPLDQAGARGETLASLAVALPIGMVLLLPSLWVLYRVFKGPRRPQEEGSLKER